MSKNQKIITTKDGLEIVLDLNDDSQRRAWARIESIVEEQENVRLAKYQLSAHEKLKDGIRQAFNSLDENEQLSVTRKSLIADFVGGKVSFRADLLNTKDKNSSRMVDSDKLDIRKRAKRSDAGQRRAELEYSKGQEEWKSGRQKIETLGVNDTSLME